MRLGTQVFHIANPPVPGIVIPLGLVSLDKADFVRIRFLLPVSFAGHETGGLSSFDYNCICKITNLRFTAEEAYKDAHLWLPR